MAQQVVTSKKYSINWQDILKGLLIGTLTPVIVIIQASLESGSLAFNWHQIGMAAVAGFVAYIVKNFLTPQQIITKAVNSDGIDSGDRPPVNPDKP